MVTIFYFQLSWNKLVNCVIAQSKFSGYSMLGVVYSTNVFFFLWTTFFYLFFTINLTLLFIKVIFTCWPYLFKTWLFCLILPYFIITQCFMFIYRFYTHFIISYLNMLSFYTIWLHYYNTFRWITVLEVIFLK